ncbi:MAG: ABC-type proline/glycine betaine transport system ATPase subunit, partial [Alteromonadaceae bacterium]
AVFRRKSDLSEALRDVRSKIGILKGCRIKYGTIAEASISHPSQRFVSSFLSLLFAICLT